jgi:type VI secretion system protein ImpL
MKQILAKILKAGLILTAILLALLIVFGLVLTLGWPWWVGLFVLVGLVGLWIGGLFLKKLWRRRREQRFVDQIIQQDDFYVKQMGAKDKERHQELQERWRDAVGALKQSHLKKLGNPLYVLPWYMIIGESGSGKTTAIQSARLSSPFVEVTRTSGISGTRNCDWWFFEKAVLLDTAGRYAIPVDEGRDREEWQRFLALLSKYRKKEPLNGLVVTVSADKLLESGAEKLAEDGLSIRRRMDELMRVLGAKFPVYVLVSKCDLIQGMNPFCARLTGETLNQAMGFVNAGLTKDIPGIVERAIHTVGERLRELRLLLFHKPEGTGSSANASQTQDPALLMFPEEFEGVKPGLSTFLHSAFQENPFQETPILRGVYFSSGRQEGTPYSHFLKELGLIGERDLLPGTNKGLFLHDFFSVLLPKDRYLFVPTQRAMDWNRLTRNLGLTSWVALGIAICGLLSFSFVKNLWTLKDISQEFSRPPILQGDILTDVALMDRYRTAILEVGEKNQNWWIPRLGLQESLRVETQLKERYCKQFNSAFLEGLDTKMSNNIAGFSAATPETAIADQMPHLVRRINLLHSRLKGHNLASLAAMPQPSYTPLAAASGHPGISEEITGRFASLYLHYLIWHPDLDVLNQEMTKLQGWLRHILSLQEGDLKWLVTWVNQNTNLPTIQLADFWGETVKASSGDRIPAAFTLAGKDQVHSFLQEIERALVDPLILTAKKLEFEDWYGKNYVQAWESFAVRLPKALEFLTDRAAWQQVAARVGTPQGPYLGFLDKMAAELKPYAEGSDEGSQWIRLVYALEAAKFQAAGAEAVKDKSVLAKTTEKGKSILSQLEKRTDVAADGGLPADQFAAGKAYLEYQRALTDISPSASSGEVAFQLATQTFKKESAAESPFFKAQNAFEQMRNAIKAGGPKRAVLWEIIGGPLKFFQIFVSTETGCHLQTLWENQVLVEIQGVSDQTDLNRLLFENPGFALKFIQGPAQPFMDRSLSKGFFARGANGLEIAFDPAFLSFLGRGVEEVSRPRKENYSVTFVGQPTSANPEASIQPTATRLELQCTKGEQVLINRHYPIKKTFEWSPASCGDVVFQIYVGNLVLTQKYTGYQAFARFLQDFSKGTKIFSPVDFPSQQAALQLLGIRTIRVEYEIQGLEAVIQSLRQTPGRVPRNIVSCWNR